MAKTVNYIVLVIIILLIGFALGESIGRIGDLHLAKVQPDIFEKDSHDIHYAKNALLMYIHVIVGMLFLLSGSFQLIPYFRKKFIKAHRFIGKIFLILSAVVSFSAIILACFVPFGNWIESMANLIFGIFILYATVKAYTTIKQKRVLEHSYWVRRVFFVSLSIATIRIIMITLMITTGKSVSEVMGISFLIGFLLHTICVELWIKNHKKQMTK